MEHLLEFLELLSLESFVLWMDQFEPVAIILAASALGASIAIIGGLGKSIGQGYAAGMGAEAVGRNPKDARQPTFIMLLGSAVAETSAIFSLIVALMLLYANPLINIEGMESIWMILAASSLAAGIAMNASNGPGIGQGYTAGKAVSAVSNRPDLQGPVLRTMFLGQAVGQTTGIYALIIALILLYANPLI